MKGTLRRRLIVDVGAFGIGLVDAFKKTLYRPFHCRTLHTPQTGASDFVQLEAVHTVTGTEPCTTYKWYSERGGQTRRGTCALASMLTASIYLCVYRTHVSRGYEPSFLSVGSDVVSTCILEDPVVLRFQQGPIRKTS